jgi:hypothetical protein
MTLAGISLWECELTAGEHGNTAEMQPTKPDVVGMFSKKRVLQSRFSFTLKRLRNGSFWVSGHELMVPVCVCVCVCVCARARVCVRVWAY